MSETGRSILDLLRRYPGGLSTKKAARLLSVPRDEYRLFRRQVLQLLREGQIRKHRERLFLQSADNQPSGSGAGPRRSGRGSGRKHPFRVENEPSFTPGSPDTERALGMEEIRRQFDLPTGFSRKLLSESDRMRRLDPGAQEARVDLRHLPCLTIDPADARDHDDAISLEELPDGLRRLGVHIADVAEYVREGTNLDREAFRRGNSSYFYLDTIPMLPPLLSGQLCSLHSAQDRPAVSVLMDCDREGRVLRSIFAESLIHVDASLSYEEAEALLSGQGEGEAGPTLRAMHRLASELRRGRRQSGALEFELPEIRPVDKGEGVTGFKPATILRSHIIVEEFMLAANHEVGHLLGERGRPRVFRVHESPDPEKVFELRQFLDRERVAFNPSDPPSSRDYQSLADRLKNHPARERLLVRMLRSMKKACYSERDLGHFGLAWRDYLHFTSPIRRYADLLVHRELKDLIRGGGGKQRQIERRAGAPGNVNPVRRARRVPRRKRGRPQRLSEIARAISECEVRSLEAEREGMRLEMALWARQRVGESFAAFVLEVFPTGLLLRLPASGVEGFMPAQFLGSEYFAYDELRCELRGEHSARAFRAGQNLLVRILGANLFSRRIQFSLEELESAYETRDKP